MNLTRRLAALVAASLVVLQGAAHASGDQLGLSQDGQTWSTSIPALFGQTGALVPGDTVTSTFHVRNSSRDRAVLAVAGSTTDTDSLVASGALRLSVQFGTRPWQPLRKGRLVLPSGGRLAGGASVPARVRIELSPAAGPATMADAASFALELRLTEARGSHGGDGPDPSPGPEQGHGHGGGQQSGGLPATGAPAYGWPLVIGSTLVGAGLALVARRRREEHPGVTP